MAMKDWFKEKAEDYWVRAIRNPIWGKKLRGMGFPTHDILTTTETPTERDLKRLRLDQIFVSRIKTLKMLEARWDMFRKGWEEMIKEYGVVSFMKHPNLEGEFSMVKSGASHTIDKRLKKILEDKNTEDNKPMLDALNSSLGKEDQRLGKGNVDAVELRIDLPGKKAIEEKYFVPPTIPVRYYASWINDKDDLLSDYELAYFGWEANSTWKKHYVKFIKDILKKARKELDIKEEVVLEDGKATPKDSISILEKVSLQTLNMIMNHIYSQEKKWYDYRDTFTGTVDKISSIKKQIGSKELPNKIMDICFHRTYKIVDPRKIIGQEWYYNPRRFLERLDRLNKILPEDERVELEVGGKKIKDLDKVKRIENVKVELKEIDERLTKARRDRDDVRVAWLEGKKGEYEREYAQLKAQKDAYDKFMEKYINLEMQLKDKNADVINAANNDMDEVLDGFRTILKDIKARIIRKGYEFPFIGADDIKGWNEDEVRLLEEGELIPGLDENGWPLEVIGAGEDYVFLGKNLRGWGLDVNPNHGYVLVDLFDYALGKRPFNKIRKIKKEQIIDMDELLWATTIHNEFDAIRDDLRDGRYHPDSLTVVDYIMARKKIGPEKWKVPVMREEWKMIGEKALMDDGKAKAFREDIAIIRADGTSVKVDGTGPRRRRARGPTDLIPAFDLRFLKIMGLGEGKGKGKINEEAFKFKHLGRKYYYDPAARISDPQNDIRTLGSRGVAANVIKEFNKYIGPCITSRGISIYITETIVLSIADFQKSRARLRDWSTGVYYDIGPRAFNKDGPTDPFDLSRSVEDGEAEINEIIAKAAELEKTAQGTDVFDIL